MDNDNKCVFLSSNRKRFYACRILETKECNGLNTRCKCYKTKKTRRIL